MYLEKKKKTQRKRRASFTCERNATILEATESVLQKKCS